MDKAFLKWAGGKTRALPEILPVLQDLIKEHKVFRFIEPFLGSGVVSLNVKSVDTFVLNDFNKDLIAFFNLLKKDEDFILHASAFFSEKSNNVVYFKEMVTRFNGSTDSYTRALIFLYLNKHCFNGLMRYNKSGNFNTPFGTYNSVTFPKEALENYRAKMLNNLVTITEGSFKDCLALAKNGDLVYCDPPYVNLEDADSFNLYGKEVFSSQDQKDLVVLAKAAVARGAVVVISNHNTPETQELYKDASFKKEFSVSRSIAANGANRKSVGELLVVYK